MGARLAVLIVAGVLAAGCVKAPSVQAAVERCRSCHTPHYVHQGACQQCHRGNALVARKDLAHQGLLSGRVAEWSFASGGAVREGRGLVESSACRRCHTIAGSGNRLATPLGGVLWKREQRALVASIAAPAAYMPDFGLGPPQIEAVLAYLLQQATGTTADSAYRVQFSPTRPSASTFASKCGACHRALGAAGPLGDGVQGPNLSGLFTPFYPHTAPGNRPWSPELLHDWLANPRTVRTATTMLPVPITAEELQRVIAELSPDQAAPRP